jgi:pimeloyl-ACP methyl ester carboxylesterase
MAVLSELRYPTTRLAKILSGLLALALFGFVAISTVSGFLLYQLLRPARTPTAFDLTVMMGHPTTYSFSLDDGAAREGWFFPGLRGAPTVIVSHGYRAQRADVLTLVTALQEQQFNVFLFDYTGHGTSAGVTTLGYKETSELRAAVQSLSMRDDVDPKRFGLWGMDMGGYVTLELATTDPRVVAFSVDDANADPRDMVQLQVRRSGLTLLPGVSTFSDIGFRLLNYSFRGETPVSLRLARTSGIPKLFIETDDRPELANDTLQLFGQAPEPKQLVRHRQNYSDMSDDDRKTYESQIVNFFLQAIPPSSQASGHPR